MREATVVNDTKSKSVAKGATGPAGGRPFNPKDASFARAVGTFVPKLTRKAVEKYGFSAAALITDWAVIVGPDLARYTQPKRLKWPRSVDAYGESDAAGRPGATLELRVDGARALDVQYKQQQIIERINSYFGYRAIADMRIIQTAQEAFCEPKPTPRQVVARKSQGSGPSPDLSQVTDEPLRAALERLQRSLADR